MFGFSLAKLVVAAFLILAAWYGFKMMTRLSEARSAALPRDAAAKGSSSRRTEVEDLTECRKCGAFVSANAKACTRADCPYPR
jgi:hypothetical protein